MAASTARHETRALLRAHLAAASGYRHLTRHCPICHQLLRLAMEPVTASQSVPPPRTAHATRRGPSGRSGGRGARRPRDRPGRTELHREGRGRKSCRHVTEGEDIRLPAVAGSTLARLGPCDGCHSTSFEKG
ncbi:DUF6274 family protein [Streptomyces yanii]|uniref:DUF6274 family protein n=1 Tax=Streptomyces yanii TaxID=78510 RepID=UPI003CD0C441